MTTQRNMVNNGPNIWLQMGYVPPRGPCTAKQGIVNSRCPCKRFMLHPLKAATSYECDGCAHHATFHEMENEADDAARKKWDQEARAQAEELQQAGEPPRKRTRAIYSSKTQEVNMHDASLKQLIDGTAGEGRNALMPKAGSSGAPAGPSRASAPRAAAIRSKNKTLFSEDDDSRVEELD